MLKLENPGYGNANVLRQTAEQALQQGTQLHRLLDSIPQGIYQLDLDGNCTFCNRACLHMLGYNSSDEVLGKPFHPLAHPAEHNGSSTSGNSSSPSFAADGAAVHVEDGTIWRADGISFPAEYWSQPIVDEGRVVGWVVTFLDITQSKQAEAACKSARREAELFINSVPSILIGLDSAGQICRWNRAAAEHFGLAAAAAIGQTFGSCGVRWRGRDIDAEIRSLAGATEPVRWDDVTFEKAGQERQLGLMLSWIRWPNEQDAKLLIVGADVTERRRAEEELRQKTAFLEAQTDSTGDGILVVDADNRKLLQNRRLRELFGIPQDIMEERDNQRLREHILHRTKHPEQFLAQIRWLYAHKTEAGLDEMELQNGVVLERYSAPVLGRDGTYYGRIWTFRDITERRRLEGALRQLSLAVEQSPVSIVITDLCGKITYVNRKFSEASGYSRNEVLGKNPRFLKSGHTSARDYQHLWNTITRGEEWRGIFHNRKKSGELYWEEAVIQPIADQEGVISHFLGMKEDITDKLTMETQLHQAQKLEAIGQLAAGIAHEINTPMQYIGDNVRFLASACSTLVPVFSILSSPTVKPCSEVLDALQKACGHEDLGYFAQEAPSAIEACLEGVHRVTRIVQAMKEFSHPGPEKKLPTDIHRAIETTTIVARNEWKYVADLETSFADDLGLVPCHAGEFNQVIVNLVTNAAHAIGQAQENGLRGKGKITIRTRKVGDMAEISIADTGAGVPEEIRARIFEPFFTTKGTGKGTGQGLALAHNTIVARHKGMLWFESEVGKGTTFFIRLPLQSDHVESAAS